MLTAWARRVFRPILEAIARLFLRLGFTPNRVSILGLVLQAAVAVIVASGRLQLGGALLILFSAFDALDGTLARMTGQVSRFGAFLDATFDRYAEALVLMGLLIHASHQDNQEQVLLIYAAIVGSLLVSYTRAKAESLNIACTVGILTRAERIALLVAGLLLNSWRPLAWLPDLLTVSLWLIAVLANITAVQRIWAVWQETSPDRIDRDFGSS